MSEGPERIIKLRYVFDCSAATDEIVKICDSIGRLDGVANVEMELSMGAGGVFVPGGTPIRHYELMVVLQSKTAVGTVQAYLQQYREDVTNLKIGLYMGTYQKLD